MKLSRLDKADAGKGMQSFGINSDLVAGLEMPSIRSGGIGIGMEALNMAGWRDKAEKGGGMRDCKTLFWTLL